MAREVTSPKRKEIALRIADELASCNVKLVASLPDDWITPLINTIDEDERFTHIPVNREESAVGLCSGAYMGGMGSLAMMGASGFMTVIYAFTKINYSYEIPLFMLITLRGNFGDHAKYHVSNGLYLRPLLETLNLPYAVIASTPDIKMISRVYRQSRTFCRPMLVAVTRDLIHGEASS